MDDAERIGEIIETGTVSFVAESFTLNRPPALGRLVYVQSESLRIYGIVCYGATASPDPGRRAVRRSTAEVFDQDIYQHHPQLQHTLRTEFTARLVGYAEGVHLYRYLPAAPPPLHYSVHNCPISQVTAFTDDLAYLRLILQTDEIPAEQLIAAHVRQVYRARSGDQAWLAFAARQVAALFKGDYDRLMTVLYGISPTDQSAG